jgi:hypothetical protein
MFLYFALTIDFMAFSIYFSMIIKKNKQTNKQVPKNHHIPITRDTNHIYF